MFLARKLFSLRFLFTWIVLGTSLLLTGSLLSILKHEGDHAAMETAEGHFQEIATKNLGRIEVLVQSLATLVDTAALSFHETNRRSAQEALGRDIASMRAMVDSNRQLMSVYIGYSDGGFHQFFALRESAQLTGTYQAPHQTAYIDRRIIVLPNGERPETWIYLDQDLRELGRRFDPDAEFDPRNRPWYMAALTQSRCVFSSPYVFSSSRLPGLTCSRTLVDGDGVFGADITLDELADMLAAQRVTEHGAIWLVDRENRLVALPGLLLDKVVGEDLRLPLAAESANPLVRAVAQQLAGEGPSRSSAPFLLKTQGETLLASALSMPRERGLDLTMVVAAPMRDITGHIDGMVFRIVLITAGILALVVPMALFAARRASRALGELVREAERIQRFDFSTSPPVATYIKEVAELAKDFEVMKSTIQSRTVSLVRTQEKLEMLVQAGLALSGEKDLASLVERIFRNAQNLAHADGGVLYLITGDSLGVELISLGSESLVLGGLSEHPAPRVMVRPAIMDFLHHDSVLRSACEAFNTRAIVTVQDRDLSLFPTGLPEEPKGYPIHSLVAIPIVTRRDEVLGVIQLFNPHAQVTEEGGDVLPPPTRRFIGSLAAQAAVTLDNRNLVESLRELFNGLIQVIATSIDAKSPYTAGHCARVTELTQMLARAVHDTQEGPLADFRFSSEDDWRQLWIAAWLHDCGKVTTPEYVVDKATKLETIYNRIHEIRTRFEVLHRDALIEYYKELGEGEKEQDKLGRELDAKLKSLEEDFGFVAQCNLGGESMTEEAKDRLHAIAERTWMRHFSDRLGVSFEELSAKGDASEPALPVTERLLENKPEHLVARSKYYSHIKDIFHEPIKVPKHEYDRGELYNLCISRGTLTPEERFKINEHTLCGIEMLRRIPFPESLAKAPDIAASHHETLVGTGYPLHKSKEHLPVEARVLALADIFEALTASDRPYKAAKKVSEALRIMTIMRNDQHIDPDVFDIFLRQGVFRHYAATFLQPWQDDVEDVTPYVISQY